MHDLFEQLAQEGEDGIKRLISERVQENVELEFKGKANPDNGELTKDDRRHLGITLSALSNSMGGLLIWGVVAAKNEDKIDCASELKPISQIGQFRNEIERAISQAIMPRHDGIRVLPINSSVTAVRAIWLFMLNGLNDGRIVASLARNSILSGLATVQLQWSITTSKIASSALLCQVSKCKCRYLMPEDAAALKGLLPELGFHSCW